MSYKLFPEHEVKKYRSFTRRFLDELLENYGFSFYEKWKIRRKFRNLSIIFREGMSPEVSRILCSLPLVVRKEILSILPPEGTFNVLRIGRDEILWIEIYSNYKRNFLAQILSHEICHFVLYSLGKEEKFGDVCEAISWYLMGNSKITRDILGRIYKAYKMMNKDIPNIEYKVIGILLREIDERNCRERKIKELFHIFKDIRVEKREWKDLSEIFRNLREMMSSRKTEE